MCVCVCGIKERCMNVLVREVWEKNETYSLLSLTLRRFKCVGMLQVVFYVVGVMVTMVVTCGTRTGSARLPLLLLITVSFAIERLVTFLVLNYLQPASPQVRFPFFLM